MPPAPRHEWEQILYANYWAGATARELGLIAEWQGKQKRAIAQMAIALSGVASILDHEKRLNARLIAEQLSRLLS